MKLTVITLLLFICCLAIISCQSESEIEFARYYANGKSIYQSKCQNCHGSNGEGLLALIPPLTDTAYLKKNKQLLACNIKYGFGKKIKLVGKLFEGQMPAIDLPPIQLAEVLTFTGNSFGNKLGIITADDVTNDLGKCP